ncbi:glycosyl transferase [Limtongia smithiae]|uniref:glycosyl transferase n=1 Tax=Limtongia smithiae TaxID=1125753 RepID=UPI0034CE1AB2
MAADESDEKTDAHTTATTIVPPKSAPLVDPIPDESTPLSVFLATFKAARTQWVARQVVIMVAVLFRLGVGLGPYSGFGVPPMHGDFEAQRHWLEIASGLPLSQWYFYDLQYWGLDYPPLTAYHSWVLGWVARKINPEWVALDTSRGIESATLKSYMRLTVILSELLIYTPAVSAFVRWSVRYAKLSPLHQSTAAAAILLQPALILIDHGHFQYNCVMLGLALFAFTDILNDNLFRGSIFFVLALGFKQMALYYAIPVFAYLLGICIFPRVNIPRFVYLAVAVLIALAGLVFPFAIAGFLDGGGVAGTLAQLHQIVFRVFPFARGLWEDKVANLWCTLNTFIKLKQLFTPAELQQLSLFTTLAFVLPVFAALVCYPRKRAFMWGVSASAWAFFLFSFQVHEKSVLLPLLPVTLQLSGDADIHVQSVIYWINNIAVFSLWPLLQREGLTLQYFVSLFLWNWLMSTHRKLPPWLPARLVVVGSYVVFTGLHVVEYCRPAPASYPDLYVLANGTLAFGCFMVFLLWNYAQLVKECGNRSP